MIIVCVALALYLVFLLRRPIGWLLAALFLTIALSGPVNVLSRKMRRGFAITLVYLGLLLVPFLLGGVDRAAARDRGAPSWPTTRRGTRRT